MVRTCAITLAQCGVAIALLLALSTTAAAHERGERRAPAWWDLCADAPPLEPGESVRSVLEPGGVHCYAVELRTGQYVKLTVDGIGRAGGVELWLPGDGTQEHTDFRSGYSRGEVRGSAQVITAVAAIEGTYLVTVGPLRDGGPALPYRIEITELLPADGYRDRLDHAKSDPRVEWLRENAVPIRTLAPEDEDFADLRPLAETLESVDVVLLGEATHWDAPTFHAKTRLVKFLHQEMGFDVLVFENDLYQTWRMWQAIEEGESPRDLVRQWMHGMYSQREFVPLLDYVGEWATSERPLELAGADPFIGEAADRFRQDLESFLGRIGVDREREPAYAWVVSTLREAHEALGEWGLLPADHPFGEEELSAFAEAVTALQGEIRSREPEDQTASFWIQVLDNAPGWLERHVAFSEIVRKYPGEDLLSVFLAPGADPDWDWDWDYCSVHKDASMADNVVWLAEEHFAGRKVIVWAHTGHLYRNPHTMTPPGILDDAQTRCVFQHTRLEHFTVMGHDVYEALGDRAFTLGVISYEGKEPEYAGDPQRVGVPINRDQVEELELEELFYLAGYEYALVDLRSLAEDGAWLHDRLYARTAPHRALRARWPAVLDGFLFIRETYPTERLPAEVDHR